MAAHSASTSSLVQSLPPRIEPQYVRIVGDSVGVVNLTPAALQCLADKLTQVLSRCSVLAHKFTVHGRRRTMNVEDVQHALRELNIPMPIGALTRSQPAIRQLRMPGGEQLYVREDTDVDVQSISQPPQMKIPVKRHIRVHWIRVDSEEEPPQEKKAKKTSHGSGASSTDLPAALRKRVPLPAELAAPSVSFRLAAQGIPKKEQILVKPSFLEPLSVEQQIYLKEIVEACVGQDDRKRQQALQSLERDTGIQELLPRLSRLIHTSVRCNIVHRCLSMLIYVVRMMRSIAVNKSVKLDGVLHEFLPSLMSCMLGRVLCTRPDSDNHWALRDFAGKTLITIIKDHGTKETKRRSFRAVKRIFDDPSSSYSMIYGTITTLLEFASPVELIRLHPRIMVLLERTRTAATTSADQQERIEAHKLHAALTKHEPALRRLIKQAAQASRKDHPKGYV
ncbi:TAF domain-containing protein [Trichostrongylus colubriformis]|uniref:Transcription initiation factor TFIID subunit 6 n=1 Tax=Trichostrongylus colubriformis TaxID=6319 RepID=A0AAN8IDN8_TRICO